jgi:DNA polymerase elongation subunit (family B)
MPQLYLYTWEYSDQAIHAYGLNESDSIVHLIVRDFQPYFYVVLPFRETEWTQRDLDQIHRSFSFRVFRQNEPIRYELVQRKPLYYASSQPLTCIRFVFASNDSFHLMRNSIESASVRLDDDTMVGGFQVHEYNVSPILQYVCEAQLQTTGWVEYTGTELTPTLFDSCHLTASDSTASPPHPTILSFDAEVYSSVPNRFPSAKVSADVIFQISLVFWKPNVTDSCKQYLLVIGKVNPIDGVNVISTENEGQLLQEFANLVRRENPVIITGWNITQFDFGYLIDRAKHCKISETMSCVGVSGKSCAIKNKSWESRAYGKQTYMYYDWDGRVVVDALVYARRSIKSENYKLGTIASSELKNAHKDPLTAKDIFEAYRASVLERRPDGTQLMTTCGVYCVKDSVLVQMLFDKWDIWVGSLEMASVCNIPMSCLFTNGQQLKVFSQVYRYCHSHDILVQSNAYKCESNEQYQGAYVKDPVPGIYEYVVPFDFSSLYPSLIVAYNIDYSTFVIDASIPDELCHVMEWTEDHWYDIHVCPKQNCHKETRGVRSDSHNKFIPMNDSYSYQLVCEECGRTSTIVSEDCYAYPGVIRRGNTIRLPSRMYTDTFRYRFLKEPKGVLPTIIVNLLDARSKTKKQMEQTTDPAMRRVLNQRQLSYKVSANSMYGALGVKEGMLPLMPGAMCVTAMGRRNLNKAGQHLLTHYGVKWVYSDTDSTYVQFPGVAPEALWAHARRIEKEMVEQRVFPEPMALLFEKAIYQPFFILTKKRYMWNNYLEDGTIALNDEGEPKIGKKGVILARRGSSKFLHQLYESTVEKILRVSSRDVLLNHVVDHLNQCCCYALPITAFVMSKVVNGTYAPGRALPAHVQLANMMRQRGTMVDVGERIEYVVTLKNGLKGKLENKVEEVSYQQRHAIWIDHLYYVHSAIEQIDELLSIAFGVKQFTDNQYKLRMKKALIQQQIRELFHTKVRIEAEEEKECVTPK